MHLDHREMAPPSLHAADAGRAGDTTVWHLRIAQPGVSRIPGQALHTLEHALLCLPEIDPHRVIGVAPMGCQTGLYIITKEIPYDALAGLVADALRRLLAATEIPYANSRECGAWTFHSLAGAQDIADWLLRRRYDWSSPLRESE